MKQKQPDIEFVERVRRELDRGVEDLEPGVTQKLRHARLRALAQEREGNWDWLKPKRLLPAAAMAVALILFVVLHDYGTLPTSGLTNGIEDVEILASTDNPDFFHDLDFYSWLAEEMDRTG